MAFFDFLLNLFKKPNSDTGGKYQNMQKIVPLYVDVNSKVWNELLKKSPQIVIINPADGPGPKDWSGRKQWIDLIKKLKTAGWKILYYLDVQQAVYKNGKWALTRKTEKQLLGEKAVYDLYPVPDGYFLDDYPQKELYPEIISLEKALKGIICANPGTTPDKKVIDASKATIFVLHETNGYPKSKPNLTGKQCCAIVFSGTDDKKLQDQKWDYGVVYKNKESANPFTTLPINL